MMKRASVRMKTLLHDLLSLWKKEKKKTGQGDPAIARAVQSIVHAKKEKKALPKTELLGIEALVHSKKKPSTLKWIIETVLTLSIALGLAILIRQTWFELYEIPTGSMRPTFKEQDRVLVSKTAFGLNIPLMTKHLTFSQKRAKRGSIVVITGDQLNLPDTDTTYFGLFPAKKRYVKRLVGLPNEYLYFYGGNIYILKADGTSIENIGSIKELSNKEYIPFISFEGKVEAGKETSRFSKNKEFLLLHFDRPIGKVEITHAQRIKSKIFSGGRWIEEFHDSDKMEKNRPQSFGEFWGINNFAKCRFLLPSELPSIATREGYVYPEATAYLELHHSPTLPKGVPSPKATSWPLVETKTTFLPLQDSHIEALVKGISTARFVIKDGHIYRYHYENAMPVSVPLLKDIPDGTYEFINGHAYQIGLGGHATLLNTSHSIYPATVEELAFWYNGGIDMHPDILDINSSLIPSRFGYFKNGAFYTMGTQIIARNDPLLQWFTIQEVNRQAHDPSYIAFQDHGSPDVVPLDAAFLKAYGFHIPESHYLVLGDNHAMSVDGRFFGTIPEANIQGSPLLILWPFGDRWGYIAQPKGHIPSFWGLVFTLTTIAGYVLWKRHVKKEQRQLIQECMNAENMER